MAPTREELKANEETFLARCKRSGARAFEVGLRIDQCPLAPKSDARKAWRAGWREAEIKSSQGTVT